MDAGLGGGIAHHTDGFARTFARARVGLSTLAAHRQAAQVTDAPVAFDTLQALQIHANLATEVAFDDVLAILDGMDNQGELLLGEIFGTDGGVDLGISQDDLGIAGANAVDVTQSDVDAFVGGDFYSDDAGHKLKTGLLDWWINGLMVGKNQPWRCLWRAGGEK